MAYYDVWYKEANGKSRYVESIRASSSQEAKQIVSNIKNLPLEQLTARTQYVTSGKG